MSDVPNLRSQTVGASGLPHRGYFAVLIVCLALVVAASYVWTPRIGVSLLAALLVLQAVLRVGHLRRWVPRTRSTFLDVATLLLLAAALLSLAPWGIAA